MSDGLIWDDLPISYRRDPSRPPECSSKLYVYNPQRRGAKVTVRLYHVDRPPTSVKLTVGAGKIEKPVAVEVDIHGNLYVIESKKPGLKKLAKEGDAYRDPVLLIETKSQPSDVTSDGSGRIFVSQNADPGLLILDADGKTLATLDKWGEASTREIAGMVADRAGFLACGLGNRGVIVRIPMNEIIKKR